MQVLPNTHISPETAYVVEDYPYGFGLRCKIRYWIEVTKHGARCVSQTSNPKKPGLVWNKPKAGTYYRFGAALHLDNGDNVKCAGMHEYMDGEQCAAWRHFLPGVPDAIRPLADRWIACKVRFDAEVRAGKSLPLAAEIATNAVGGLTRNA